MYAINQFRRYVRDWMKGRVVPEWAIEKAIQDYVRMGKTGRDHVQECVGTAYGIVLGMQQQDAEAIPQFPPSVQLNSQNLMRSLLPDIQRLRQDLFGTERAPFKDIRQQAEWIEKTVSEWQGRAKCREWLEYARPGQNAVERVPAFVSSPLEKLETVTRELANDTGLKQAALVAHALSGIPVILSPVRISVRQQFGNAYPRTWATVEFHTADLSFEQLRYVYNKVRHRMGTVRRKALTIRDVQMLEEIYKRGEPPKREKGNRGDIKGYWERFIQDWNRSHRKDLLTLRAAQNRYDRLKGKTGRHR